MITLEPFDLPELLSVDFDKGLLFWKERDIFYFQNQDERIWKSWNTQYAGTQAFTAPIGGYFQGQIFGKLYYAHRIIWTMYYGDWPENEIDHIDRNGFNNKISNLRDVTHQVNMNNKGAIIHGL
tara:strand:- start:119 stop:490 length:372 start_codon:yes stop_codon:yes gene_type:complete